MNTTVNIPASTITQSRPRARSLTDLLAPLDRLAANSTNLVARHLGTFERDGKSYEIPRYVFVGPQGGGAPIRVGIFAGVHGDEPEGIHAVAHFAQLLESKPELATGFCLFLHPICNPTGVEDRTRHSRNGKDLNREFWRGSAEPEVRLLETALETQPLDGLISLHSDDTSNGFYGFVRGATLTRHLLRPALAAAADLLPVNRDERIDGFHARDGLIRECYPGILSAPAKVRPKPFEVILETPGQAPLFLQQWALVAALQAILAEYRKFIAYAPNL